MAGEQITPIVERLSDPRDHGSWERTGFLGSPQIAVPPHKGGLIYCLGIDPLFNLVMSGG